MELGTEDDALERIGETADTGWTPRAAAAAIEDADTTVTAVGQER